MFGLTRVYRQARPEALLLVVVMLLFRDGAGEPISVPPATDLTSRVQRIADVFHRGAAPKKSPPILGKALTNPLNIPMTKAMGIASILAEYRSNP